MAYASGLTEHFWRRYRQNRIGTGMPMSSSEISGAIEPMLAYDAQKAEAAGRLKMEQDKLDLAKKAQEEDAKGAKVSGAIQTAGTLGSLYMTNKAIDAYKGMSAAKAVPAVTPEIPTAGSFSTPYTSSPYANLGAAPSAAAGPTIDTTTGLGGVYNAGVANTGASTATAGVGGVANIGTASAAGDAGSLAAYDAAVAEGASEGVGTAAGVGGGAEIGLGSVAYPALAATAGHMLGKPVSKALGTHEKTTSDVMGTAAGAGMGAYLAAGTAVGGPVGALIGGVIGLGVSLGSDSVICNECHRQGVVSDSDMRWVAKFRREYVSESTFSGYLTWASPIVRRMRKEGLFNRAVRPFALALVHRWIGIAKGERGTVAERAVYSVAYLASRVAYRLTSRTMVKEVCANGR